MNRTQEIENTIIKKYRKEIWRNFIKAIKEFELVEEHDKIAVCISGGKDSFLLAKCMQELKRHGKYDFDLEFIVMNPGYQEKNLQKIKENSKILDIPVHIFETDIFNIVYDIKQGSPCYLCARMRRGNLYAKAKELGCNKIALGHHFDDVIETVLMSMLYGGEFKTMMPKVKSTNFEGMQLIRPLYFIKEKEIISWARYNQLEFINCACRFTEKVANKEQESVRFEMKKLVSHLQEINPVADKNIYNATKDINLNTILSYHKDGTTHHFLDEYHQ